MRRFTAALRKETKIVDLDEADDWSWSLCVLWAMEWLRPNFRCHRVALLARMAAMTQQHGGVLWPRHKSGEK